MAEKKQIALTADQIGATHKITREWVPTPELAPEETNGETYGIWVRALLASEKNVFELQCVKSRRDGNENHINRFKVRVCSRVMVNEQNEQLFSDLTVLDGMEAVVIDRLFDVAARLGGLSEDAKETAGNSKATDDDESS